MELSDYIAGAKLTESKTPDESFVINRELFQLVIDGSLQYGELLDMIKKHVFYGREYDTFRMLEIFRDIHELAESLKSYNLGKLEKEEPLYGDPRIYHSIIGINTEAVELLDQLSSSLFQGNPIDTVNILEEMGDLCWYEAIGIDACGGDWDNVLKINLRKLHKRYAGNFTKEAALDRNIAAELKILEDLIS